LLPSILIGTFIILYVLHKDMSQKQSQDGVDVSQFANDTVLIQTAIVGLMNTPKILEGEVSSTGKTISVESETVKSRRLPTAKIMIGETHYPSNGTRGFELYQKERYQNKQEANLAPGPRCGTNEVSDDDDLPDPTHTPIR
jgi:hypothetical protein